MRILVFCAVFFLLDVLFWWAGDRVLRRAGRGRVLRAAFGLFVAVQMVMLAWVLLGRFMGTDARTIAPRFLTGICYLWHLIILLPTMAIWAVISCAQGVIRLLKRGKQSRQRGDAVATALPTRRQFLATSAVLMPPALTILGTGIGVSQLESFRVRKLDLRIRNLPYALNGLKIAHVTDIHVGAFSSERMLARIADTTNNLRPDLVLLTGDLINANLSDLPGALDMVRRLDPKSGVFMCEGNHDLFEGADRFAQQVRAGGVPLLLNESSMTRVRGYDVQILGLRWGRDEGIATSMQYLAPTIQAQDAFPILLAHHPHAFDAAAEANIPLTLSGHTHGGQLMLSKAIGFGPVMYRYWSGAYQKNNGLHHAVISNGVGNWFPLRINAPAEIVSITLHAET